MGRANVVAAMRGGLLISTSLAAVMMGSHAARAACTPAAANDVTAICTGTTTNQGPAANIGYGDSNPATGPTGMNITVMPGASVTGTGTGMGLVVSGAVTNYGTIVGTNFDGISVSGANANATVINYGAIMGSASGVWVSGTLKLVNSGTITGGGQPQSASSRTPACR